MRFRGSCAGVGRIALGITHLICVLAAILFQPVAASAQLQRDDTMAPLVQEPEVAEPAEAEPAAARPATADARGGCMTPAAIAAWRDPDFARNRAALQDSALCVQIVSFVEAGLKWTLEVIAHRNMAGPLWAVPHDNENAAFNTAVYAVRRYGGVMVAVEAGERRNNGPQDPNRNFGSRRSGGACPLQRAPAPRYTREFASRANSRFPIVALHNNNPGGAIDVRRPGSGNRSFLSAVASRLGLSAPNSLVFIAGREPGNSSGAQARANALTNRGLQVIYEYVTEARNDCSLSNYVALQTSHRYYNLEVGHGNGAAQRRMLEILMSGQ